MSVLGQADSPIEEPVTDVSNSVRSITDTVVDALPRVGVGLGLVLVGYGLSRLVRWGARRWLARRRTPSFATVMSKLAGWLVRR